MQVWWALGLVAGLWALLLRLTTQLTRPGRDPGWDDALAQTLCMGALWWPIQWLGAHGTLVAALTVPPLLLVAHTWSIKIIYQTSLSRAVVTASLHGAMILVVIGGLGTAFLGQLELALVSRFF
ncbi:MAG: hypothetical protein AAGD10_00145 [Myxococcota bacterium]